MSRATPFPSPDRDSTLYLRDMVEFCEAVMRYVDGRDLATLLADRMRWDATLRNLELVGEAAIHVPAELRQLAPEVLWRQAIGMRSRLAHAYLQIEAETVWLSATQSVPTLHGQLLALLARLAQSGSVP